jgi:hypothetical protein
MAWAKNGTPVTLGSAGDDMDITDLTANKFNQFLLHTLSTVAKDHRLTTDNNGSTDYAWRRSANGGTDITTNINKQYIDINSGNNGAKDCLGIIYGVNIDGEEKLFMSFQCETTAGASNPPSRNENVSKVDVTTNTGQYTRIDINNTLTGDYLTSSNLSVIGSDGVASMTVQDGAIFYETDTNKSYVLSSNIWTEL